MKSVTVALMVLFFVAATPLRTTAQEPVRTFGELAATVKPDLPIQVTDSHDNNTDGVLTGVVDGMVTMTLSSGQTKSFAEQDVRLIYERKPFNGIATLTGAGLGVALGWFLTNACDRSPCAGYLVGLSAGLGAGVGIDLKHMYRPIFVAPSTHARLRITPFFGTQQKGVLATLRF
jgi:hypothetical protein